MICFFYYSLYEIKLIHDYMMHNNIIHTQKASLVSALKSIHKTWCCKKIKLIKKCDWKNCGTCEWCEGTLSSESSLVVPGGEARCGDPYTGAEGCVGVLGVGGPLMTWVGCSINNLCCPPGCCWIM